MYGKTLISKTPAAKTKIFQGVGGGSIEGIITARNSCRSNRVAQLLKARAVHAFQQKQLAARAANP